MVMLAISEAKEDAGVLRSMTWVAPRDLRKSVFRNDAVVIIGEKPESLANWMTS